jgi:hypothetical protein
MKKLLIAAIVMLITGQVTSQSRLKVLQVEEIGFLAKTEFKPVSRNTFLYKDLEITITPVSPEELDRMFEKAQRFDGKVSYAYYEKSRQEYFVGKKTKFRLKTDDEFLIEGLDWLMDQELISEKTYSEILKDMGDTMQTVSPKQAMANFYVSKSNPYALHDRYLSVFKVEYINKTNQSVEVNFPLQVSFNKQILNCLKPSEIIDLYAAERIASSDKFQNLMRFDNYNLKSVPPNSTATTYFSTFPIDNDAELLEIIAPTGSCKWQISTQRKDINGKYTFYEIGIFLQYEQSNLNSGESFVVLSSENNNVYVNDNKLYIAAESLSIPVQIFVYGLYNDKLYYSKQITFVPKDLIDLDRKQRKDLKMDMTQITELKKKVKN